MTKLLFVATIAGVIIMGCMSSESSMSGGIWDAILIEDIDFIDNYAKNGGNLEVGREHEGTPLFFAMKQRKKISYVRLLSLGASPNTVCDNGVVVIHRAAAEEDSFWLYEALKANGDPNLFDTALDKGPHAGQPLMYAVMEDRLENAKLLLDSGADIDFSEYNREVYNGSWETPMILSIEMNHFDISLLLLERGVDFASSPYKELSVVWKIRDKINAYMPPKEKASFEAVLQWFSTKGIDLTTAEWKEGKWHFPSTK